MSQPFSILSYIILTKCDSNLSPAMWWLEAVKRKRNEKWDLVHKFWKKPCDSFNPSTTCPFLPFVLLPWHLLHSPPPSVGYVVATISDKEQNQRARDNTSQQVCTDGPFKQLTRGFKIRRSRRHCKEYNVMNAHNAERGASAGDKQLRCWQSSNWVNFSCNRYQRHQWQYQWQRVNSNVRFVTTGSCERLWMR